MCMEQTTVMTASRKFSVRWWPKSAAETRAVKIVAIVELYFFSRVSAYLQVV